MLLDLPSFCIVRDTIPQDVNDPKDVNGVLSPVMRIQGGPPNSVAKTTAALTTQTVIDSSTGGAATSIKRSPTITTLEVVVVAVGTFSAYILESDVLDLRLRDLGMPSGGPSQRSRRSFTVT